MSVVQILRQYFYQFIAASAANLGSFGLGCILAWSSPALPRINQDECKENCDLTGIDMEWASWIAPLVLLGAAISGPVAGYLAKRIGRKKTMICFAIPFFIGFVLVAISASIDNVFVIYIGRFVAGFFGGAFALLAPLYTSETTDKSIRGATSAMTQLSITLGVTFVFVLNIKGAVHWVSITSICSVIPVVMAVLMYFMPESPFYLISQGNVKEAEKSLQFLRRSEEDVATELHRLEQAKKNQDSIGSISVSALFSESRYLKPFSIAMTLMFLQQFAGVNVIMSYTQTIFEKAGSSLDPGFCAFLVALFQFLGTGVSLMIVDKFGRKILLLISEIFICLAMATLGTFFYLDENKEVKCDLLSDSVDCVATDGFDVAFVESLGWLPLLSLIVYIFFFSIGIGPLAWTMNVELVSPECKSLSTSIAFTFNWTCAFLVTKFEPNLEVYIQASGAYFFFGSICLLGIFFVLFFVPETKGKTSEEIQNLFCKVPLKHEKVTEKEAV